MPTDFYHRDALERVAVMKAKQLRCDGYFRGTRCNQVLAEDFEPGAGGRLALTCRRCGRRHEIRG